MIMNAQIKQRAKDIMKADMTNMLIGAAIFAAVSLVSSALTGGLVGNAVAGLINAVAGACAARFYFRAYNRGKADVNDIFALLKDSANLSKVLTIMVAIWLVNIIIEIICGILVFIPLLGAIAVLVIGLLASLLLRIVWHLFVANPQYPTEYYLKGSSSYMGGQLVAYIVFSFSVAFVPALIEILVSIFVGGTIANILCIPFDAYISLATSGFVATIIPDEWYNGTAQM